jgi:hypothetical protein
MASAAEAKVGGLFTNGEAACPIQTTLIKLGHNQPATIMITDNECANGIANGTVKQRRSKAIDMQFYWIQDRVSQGQFTIYYWKKGTENLADYFTKDHPPAHHQRMQSRYLQQTDHGQGYNKQVRFKQDTTTTQQQHEKYVRSEGVLKNKGASNTALTLTHHNYPIYDSVPISPSTQTGPNDVAVAPPPCSQARLTD